jgi:hypothetical protein
MTPPTRSSVATKKIQHDLSPIVRLARVSLSLRSAWIFGGCAINRRRDLDLTPKDRRAERARRPKLAA